MVEVFREVKRVLKKEGTLWLNLGDSYNGSGKGGDSEKMYAKRHTQFGKICDIRRHGVPTKINSLKPKDLVGIPWRVAFALQADGWYLRQDIIWAKPNPMPESVTDRCTKSHEYIFLLAKSQKYYFDNEVIKENAIDAESYTGRRFRNATAIVVAGGRPGSPNTLERAGGQFNKKYEKVNKRSVWTITTKPFKEAHFATFPEDLIVPMVKAGCPERGIILDPFFGAGTTGLVAQKLNRNWVGIELNPGYIKIANERLKQKPML